MAEFSEGVERFATEVPDASVGIGAERVGRCPGPVRIGCEEPGLRIKRPDIVGAVRCAVGDLWGVHGVPGVFEQIEQEPGQSRDRVRLRDVAEEAEQALEDIGVRVKWAEQGRGKLGGEHRDRGGPEIGPQHREGVDEIPLGEGDQIAIGFVDEAEFTELEMLEPPREGCLLAVRAFGEAVDETVLAGEERDRLAGLGPFAVSQADGVVVGRGHAWRVSGWWCVGRHNR